MDLVSFTALGCSLYSLVSSFMIIVVLGYNFPYSNSCFYPLILESLFYSFHAPWIAFPNVVFDLAETFC